MSVRFGVTTNGLDNLITRLNNRVNFLGTSSTRALLNDKAQALLKEFKRNIDSFTPGDVPDLAMSTKKQKQKKYGRTYPILKATSEMYEKMAARVRLEAGRGWVISIFWRGGLRSAKENSDIADAHLKGNSNLPQRNFIRIPPNFRRNLLKSISDGIRSQR